MSVEELENAITQLSPQEMATLAKWFDQYRADQWDRQIEADIRASRLDDAGQQADVDFDAERYTAL